MSCKKKTIVQIKEMSYPGSTHIVRDPIKEYHIKNCYEKKIDILLTNTHLKFTSVIVSDQFTVMKQ